MKVASFNIQKFGENKVSDRQTLANLIKGDEWRKEGEEYWDAPLVIHQHWRCVPIFFTADLLSSTLLLYLFPTRKYAKLLIVSRYGIILILEVVDVKGTAMITFLKELNKVNKKHPYTMVMSSRLGRNSYKEQFMFLYREDLVTLRDTYQYEDNQEGDEDAFAREPYILRFTCQNTVLKDLVLIPVHTKPKDSEKELDELYDVFLTVKKKWKTDDIMILGDFNADGSYVSKRKMKKIRIRSDKNFHWLIGDDMDTTANTGNDHTYDRIVVYGDDMLEGIVPNSAKPFDFHQAFGLTEDMALNISDHYPVEVKLKMAKKRRGRGRPAKSSRAVKRTRR